MQIVNSKLASTLATLGPMYQVSQRAALTGLTLIIVIAMEYHLQV